MAAHKSGQGRPRTAPDSVASPDCVQTPISSSSPSTRRLPEALGWAVAREEPRGSRWRSQ
eukprot:scaffold1616_cov310-Pinguiococcus_pyrenoidosus.AAC.6